MNSHLEKLFSLQAVQLTHLNSNNLCLYLPSQPGNEISRLVCIPDPWEQSGGPLVWRPAEWEQWDFFRFRFGNPTTKSFESIGDTVRNWGAEVARMCTTGQQELILLSSLLVEISLYPAFVIYPDVDVWEVHRTFLEIIAKCEFYCFMWSTINVTTRDGRWLRI